MDYQTKVSFSRQLRTDQTDAENMLWKHLRARQFMGAKFRRQQPFGNYIVDFCCFDAKLVIELDGGQHVQRAEYDQARDCYLKAEGFRVLRFWDSQVLKEIEGVMQVISGALVLPHPRPLPRGERGK